MVDVSWSILKEERRRNGPQGHSLTPTSKHDKETAIIHRHTHRKTHSLAEQRQQPSNYMTCRSFERRTLSFYGTSVMVMELHFFHTDNKVHLPTRHV